MKIVKNRLAGVREGQMEIGKGERLWGFQGMGRKMGSNEVFPTSPYGYPACKHGGGGSNLRSNLLVPWLVTVIIN